MEQRGEERAEREADSPSDREAKPMEQDKEVKTDITAQLLSG